MGFLKRILGGGGAPQPKSSNAADEAAADAKWSGDLAGYRPVLDAMALDDPEPEFAEILQRADALERDYMRRSNRGQYDVDYSGRMLGAVWVECVGVAREIRSLDDQGLEGMIRRLVGDLDSPYPLNAGLKLAVAYAERAKRTGTPPLVVPDTWRAAVGALKRAVEAPSASPVGAAAPTAAPAAGAATDSLWSDPAGARRRIQVLADHLGMSERELLARLFSDTDAPWSSFRRTEPTAHPELDAWLVEIETIPARVLDAMARTAPSEPGVEQPDGPELRRRLRAFVLQADAPASASVVESPETGAQPAAVSAVAAPASSDEGIPESGLGAIVVFVWTAWFGTRADQLQQLLFQALDPRAMGSVLQTRAAMEMADVPLKFSTIRGVLDGNSRADRAAGHLMDALEMGSLWGSIPPPLVATIALRDAERGDRIEEAAASIGVLGPDEQAAVAAVVACLVSAQPSTPSRMLDFLPEARPVLLQILSEVGLGADNYEPLVQSWVGRLIVAHATRTLGS